MHVVAAAAEYIPTEQMLQPEDIDDVWYDPPAQLMHAVPPVVPRYNPAAQFVHTVAATAEYIPTAQEEHTVLTEDPTFAE